MRPSGILVGTIGAPPSPFTARLVRRLSRELPLPCGLRGELPVQTVMLEGRAQADADALLRGVEALAEPPAVLVGLTETDIGHPIFTHFFGRARRDGFGIVVSLARLAPEFYGLPADETVLLRRATLEIVHEFGHCAGLLHCEDHGCIMRFAPTVEAIDNRGTWFCRSCEATLTPAVLDRRAL
jgi:archaemetzincin